MGARVERITDCGGTSLADDFARPALEMVRGVAKGLSVAGVFDKAVMHTPMEVVEEARNLARKVRADCCVAIGGGSPIDTCKAMSILATGEAPMSTGEASVTRARVLNALRIGLLVVIVAACALRGWMPRHPWAVLPKLDRVANQHGSQVGGARGDARGRPHT